MFVTDITLRAVTLKLSVLQETLKIDRYCNVTPRNEKITIKITLCRNPGHHIRDEWTQFGKNKFANYLNYTNNRTESINQKFKLISNRYANLVTFFDNIICTVTLLASERNIRAVRMTMRVLRRRFEDESLAR